MSHSSYKLLLLLLLLLGPAVAYWLRICATSRTVPESVVSLDFSVTYSFRPHHCPGVNSAPSEDEYQVHLLRVKAAGAGGWQPHHLHVPNVTEIWESKPPGTLWATPGLLRDPLPLPFYVYNFIVSLYFKHNGIPSTKIFKKGSAPLSYYSYKLLLLLLLLLLLF